MNDVQAKRAGLGLQKEGEVQSETLSNTDVTQAKVDGL